MRAAEYPYPPDEFDAAAAAGGPRGSHRRPRSAWSKWWPFVVVLIVFPSLAYVGVYYASNQHDSAPDAQPHPTATAGPSEGPSSGPADTPPPVDPPPETTPPETAPPADNTRAVQVQNATRRAGLAAGAKVRLQDAGFVNVASGNWAGDEVPASVVYYPGPEDSGTAAAVAQALGITATEESATIASDGLIAVLAADYQP